MSIRAFHHVAYRCRDSEETRRFYEDFLGLELAGALDIRTTQTGRQTKVLHTFFRLGDGSFLAFFEAPDRDLLLEWLLTRPLAHFDAAAGDLLIHGGLVPEWTVEKTLALAREVESALRDDPRALFDAMYGDRPDRWSEDLSGFDRLRFIINVLTRMRFCTADGRIDLRMKGPPSDARPPFLPWFAHEHRRSRDVRVIFGHWSTLGYYDDGRALALDTGCVWGGALTAVDLDDPERPPVSLPCRGYQAPGGD